MIMKKIIRKGRMQKHALPKLALAKEIYVIPERRKDQFLDEN
jgi:hypothetical protein